MTVTKEDYEEVYNDLLGIDINWSKLPLEDLKALSVLFSNPELLVRKLGYKSDKEKKREKRREKIIETGENLVLDRLDKGKGPISKLYRKLVLGEQDDSDDENFDELEKLVERANSLDIDVGDPKK